MKVHELIEALHDFPADLEVHVPYDGNFACQSVDGVRLGDLGKEIFPGTRASQSVVFLEG